MLLAENGNGSLISLLAELFVHGNGAVLIEAAVAVPDKAVVGLAAVIVEYQICGDDLIQNLDLVADAAGNAGEDDRFHVEFIDQNGGAGSGHGLADAALNQNDVLSLERADAEIHAADGFGLADFRLFEQHFQLVGHGGDDADRLVFGDGGRRRFRRLGCFRGRRCGGRGRCGRCGRVRGRAVCAAGRHGQCQSRRQNDGSGQTQRFFHGWKSSSK